MSSQKAIFNFGSTEFTVASEGRILASKMVAVVLKKSTRPFLVASGADALGWERSEDVYYIKPVRKGAVAHIDGTVLLIRDIMREAFGLKRNVVLTVLIGCGLDAEQRLQIEKCFVAAGYGEITLTARLEGLLSVSERTGAKVGLIIGGETTDAGVFHEGKLVDAYSLDIGWQTVTERIAEYVKNNYKLTINRESAEGLTQHAVGLRNNDYTRYSVTGQDALTGRTKRVTLVGKDLFGEADYVYSRILKMLDGLLMVAPIEAVRAVERNGILLNGRGCLADGLEEYTANLLKISSAIAGGRADEYLYGAMELGEKLV